MRIEKDQVITLGVIVVMVCAFVLGFWMPARHKRAGLGLQILEAQKELGLNTVAGEELAGWSAKVVSLREQVSGAQQHVPERDELGEVLQGLTDALKVNGVTEQEMVTREPKQFAHYSAIPVSLEFESSFPVVFGALQEFERMPRLIRVDELTVRADIDAPAAPMEVRIQLSTFYSQPGGGF